MHRASAAERDRHADDAVAGVGVDDAPDVVERGRIVARDAGDHRVGVAQRHHAGGEMVAVVVDQPLGVAEEVALALQPLVEEVGIDGVALRQARVDDLDAGFCEVDAGELRVLAHDLLASDQDRRAELLADIGDGGAHDLLLLALGEDDALGLAAHAVVDALQRRGDRVAAGRELLRVFLQVGDRLAGDARLHRGLGDGERDRRDQPGVEGHRDDVLRAEFRAVALVGGGDVVGHVLAGEGGERFGRGDLHGVVDGGGADIERAAEDVGEAEHVVDLVRDSPSGRSP